WPEGQTFPIRWRQHKQGENALEFDGVQQFVDMGNPANGSLDLDTSATLEAWVKFDNLPASDAVIMSKIGNTGFDANSWEFGYSSITGSTFFEFQWNFEVFKLTSSAWTPELGVWYHVALIRTGDTFAFYLNGNLNGTAAGAFTALMNSDTFRVGRGF